MKKDDLLYRFVAAYIKSKDKLPPVKKFKSRFETQAFLESYSEGYKEYSHKEKTILLQKEKDKETVDSEILKNVKLYQKNARCSKIGVAKLDTRFWGKSLSYMFGNKINVNILFYFNLF